MIDKEGYRAGVGIIILGPDRKLFWAKRVGNVNAWQFPQGGLQEGESAEEAMYRELYEEVGLAKDDVEIVAVTKRWLRYQLPKRFIRHYSKPICIGQKQKWFLLKLTADESKVCFTTSDKPEFDEWRWVSYWYPRSNVVSFKRRVYAAALKEFVGKVMRRRPQVNNNSDREPKA